LHGNPRRSPPRSRETDVETQKSGAKLVNGSDARCIEIWNNVFIQYNANPDGTFTPLPAKHVDTGMGFERVTSIIQGTKGLTDFANAKISNYETDIFRPIFDVLEKMSGKKYGSTLPGAATASAATAPMKTSGEASGGIIEIDDARETRTAPANDHRKDSTDPSCLPSAEQVGIDIAFRVIADHIARSRLRCRRDSTRQQRPQTTSCAASCAAPCVMAHAWFSRTVLLQTGDVLADTMGDVFPEIRAKKKHIQEVLKMEEEAFTKTLDDGSEIFYKAVAELDIIAAYLKTVPSLLRRFARN